MHNLNEKYSRKSLLVKSEFKLHSKCYFWNLFLIYVAFGNYFKYYFLNFHRYFYLFQNECLTYICINCEIYLNTIVVKLEIYK